MISRITVNTRDHSNYDPNHHKPKRAKQSAVFTESSKGRTLLDAGLVRRYLTNMKTTVSSKGQFVLPAEIRRRDGIEPGQEFSIERIESGEYLLKKLPSGDTTGLVDWLLRCPEKGWFESLPSESTDTL